MWSYCTVLVNNVKLSRLDDWLRRLGEDGWELVGMAPQVKSIVNVTGNSMVCVFKKAGAGHVRPMLEDADPDGPII